MTSDGLPAAAVPVHVDSRRGLVDLMELQVVTCQAGPAFALSAHESSAGRRWTGSAAAVLRLATAERLPPPRGLIFHTGRCGSTLLANLLAVHPDLRVLNEPDILGELLLRSPDDDRLLGGVLAGFSRGLTPAQGVVVKAADWNTTRARHILAALPAVPVVFVWRAAAEVVASCLHGPPAWAQYPDVRAAAVGPRPFPCSQAAALFYAEVWNKAVAAGLELVSTLGRVRILAYDQLRADPEGVCRAVASFFGATFTADLNGPLGRTARTYSKAPVGSRASVGLATFDPRGAHANAGLTSGQHRLVRKVTAPLTALISGRSETLP